MIFSSLVLAIQDLWSFLNLILNIMIELLKFFWNYWSTLWGIVGPLFLLLLILYFRYPEKIEKLIIHINWLLSYISKEYEKKAVQKEVRYIVFV